MANKLTKLSKIDTDIISQLVRQVPSNLDDDDFCLYAIEYCGNKGIEFNSLIYNIKKSINDPNVKYKNDSIKEVGLRLNTILGHDINNILNRWSIVIVPSSRTKDDPNYDNRLERILYEAGLSGSLVELFYIDQNRQPASQGGSRDVGFYESILKTDNNKLGILKDKIIIFDDVITSGAQYKAIKNILETINPNFEIRGLFLARTICS